MHSSSSFLWFIVCIKRQFLKMKLHRPKLKLTICVINDKNESDHLHNKGLGYYFLLNRTRVGLVATTRNKTDPFQTQSLLKTRPFFIFLERPEPPALAGNIYQICLIGSYFGIRFHCTHLGMPRPPEKREGSLK